MSDQLTKRRTKPEVAAERPKLRKVILLNDDFAPLPTVCNGQTATACDEKVGGDETNRKVHCGIWT